MATCQRCRRAFATAQRRLGRCPHCGSVFDTAELVALCIGLTCSYLLALVLPELVTALWRPGGFQAPADHTVLLRAVVVGALLVGGLLLLSARYALWQGAAFSVHPQLRLLWLLALPGLLYAGIVLGAGVTYLAVRRRCSPRRAFALFLATT